LSQGRQASRKGGQGQPEEKTVEAMLRTEMRGLLCHTGKEEVREKSTYYYVHEFIKSEKIDQVPTSVALQVQTMGAKNIHHINYPH